MEDFRAAFELARKQDAKSLQLRTAISMAKLQRRNPSRTSDSTMTLADTLSRFCEGYQTRGLQEALELLTP